MVHRLSVHHFQRSSPKPKPVKAKFHVEPPWVGGKKVCSGSHDPRWSPCPYRVKTLKTFLLWNQRANDLGPWYVVLGPWAHQSLFKWWPWFDVDLFYGKVKFGPLCFCMGKTVRKSFNGKNLQQMTRVTWGICLHKNSKWGTCLHKNSDPRELSAPAPRAIYMYKNMKNYV